jgi:hypothetical protein
LHRTPVRAPQAICEHDGILNRLCRALREEREHRVRGIAKQRNSAAGPVFKWRSIIQSPAPGLGGTGNQLLQPTVPGLELLEQIRNLTFGRPFLIN